VGNAHALELGLKGKTAGKPAEYLHFVEKKAASIEADMCLGAIIGGGTEAEVEALAKYGRILGILTTLREEFVDIFELEELVQKASIERLPIPIIFAMQNRTQKNNIEKILEKKTITNADAEALVDIIFNSRNVKKLKKYMEDLVAQANCLLHPFHAKDSRNQLMYWVSSMLEDL